MTESPIFRCYSRSLWIINKRIMDFYTSIADNYNNIFPLNPAQISFVNSIIDIPSSILDVGCGTGNLAISLADNEYNVTAIDPDSSMLEIARSNPISTNLDLKKLGMLDVGTSALDNTYDCVLCFGNTVVHLTDLDSIGLFFKNVRKVTSNGGIFTFQIINYDKVLDNKLSGLPTIENKHIKFERNYKVNSRGMIEFETICTVKQDGQSLVNCVELYPLRKSQAEGLLIKAGFEIIQSYSSFKMDAYNPSSLPLVFVCS